MASVGRWRRGGLFDRQKLWTGQQVALEREDGELYMVVGRPGGNRLRARLSRDEAMVLVAVLARETWPAKDTGGTDG